MSFDQILDLTMELPLTEREILIEVLSKRNIEEKRKKLALYYKDVKEDVIKGTLQPLSLNEIINQLDAELTK